MDKFDARLQAEKLNFIRQRGDSEEHWWSSKDFSDKDEHMILAEWRELQSKEINSSANHTGITALGFELNLLREKIEKKREAWMHGTSLDEPDRIIFHQNKLFGETA